MCFACRNFREHPEHLNLQRSAYIRINAHLPHGTRVRMELRGKHKVHTQETMVDAKGFVLFLLGASVIDDLPAYWYVPYTLQIYLPNVDGETAFNHVSWKDELGLYHSLRFRTCLGEKSFDGILNESAILAS